MSFLSDVLGFEAFHLGDLWDRLKDDPKRLLLGVDPASTEVWNAVLGRDDKPLVNFLGGPHSDVFARARAEGIDTGPGQSMHDIASLIAGAFGAMGLAGVAGGISGHGTFASGDGGLFSGLLEGGGLGGFPGGGQGLQGLLSSRPQNGSLQQQALLLDMQRRHRQQQAELAQMQVLQGLLGMI